METPQDQLQEQTVTTDSLTERMSKTLAEIKLSIEETKQFNREIDALLKEIYEEKEEAFPTT